MLSLHRKEKAERKQLCVDEWFRGKREKRSREEGRGGGKEEGEGKPEYCTTAERSKYPQISVQHFHVWPQAEGKVNVYLMASLCSANVSFPSLRIHRKNKRVSSARHSPKSSAYGGYFNFLIPSFLWVASLSTHTRSRWLPPLLVFLFLSNSLSPPQLPHFLFRLSHSDKHACTHRMQVSLHLWEWESESERTSYRERETSVRWLQERLKRNGVELVLSQNWSFVSREGAKRKKIMENCERKGDRGKEI